MSIKLTDTQLVMLSASAQREDRCLVAPEGLKGAALQKLARKLISAGFAKEIKAKSDTPIWRRDEESGASYALKLTAAGAEAIRIDEGVESENAPNEVGALENKKKTTISSEGKASGALESIEPAAAAGLSAPRGGSKLAQVIKLLQRNYGATIDELMASTGWLGHTTRAALTGLRKRGYAVAIDRSNDERGSFYRIEAKGDDGSVARPSEEPADVPTPRKPAQRLSKPRARRAA
jgi:hypothetical protein